MIGTFYNIDPNIEKAVEQAIQKLIPYFIKIDQVKEYNQLKIINAFQQEKLSSVHFNWTTGYGYGDVGREKTEDIFKRIFKTEDALVRPSIASGTHALSLALQANLLPGDELLSITGDPYDTLQEVIGIAGHASGTLQEYGISYRKVELNNGKIDLEKSLQQISPKTKIVMIQRSTGYAFRSAITISELEYVISTIKQQYPKVIVLVDNCYGEFTQKKEPSEFGADLCVGSLIKNPGGGIALSGGYIVGKSIWIDRISNRLTAPGLGKEIGLTFGTTRSTLQGLYFAPHITAEAMKSSLLVAEIFQSFGYRVVPEVTQEKSDIIVAVELQSAEKVIEFTRCVQEACVVDHFVVPYPWDMPGYDDQVIMASGSFIDGSSIELSCDGPLRKPYIVYFQGGLSLMQSKLAVMKILQKFQEKNWIKISSQNH